MFVKYLKIENWKIIINVYKYILNKEQAIKNDQLFTNITNKNVDMIFDH